MLKSYNLCYVSKGLNIADLSVINIYSLMSASQGNAHYIFVSVDGVKKYDVRIYTQRQHHLVSPQEITSICHTVDPLSCVDRAADFGVSFFFVHINARCRSAKRGQS